MAQSLDAAIVDKKFDENIIIVIVIIIIIVVVIVILITSLKSHWVLSQAQCCSTTNRAITVETINQ